LPAFSVGKHSFDCTVSRPVARGPRSAKDGGNQRHTGAWICRVALTWTALPGADCGPRPATG
jgi:hypothetical protein